MVRRGSKWGRLAVAGVAVVALAATASASYGSSYRVQSGDSLDAIAAQLHVSAASLAAANDLSSPDHIVIGQSLVIPGSGGSPSRSSTHSPARPTGPLARVYAPAGGSPRWPAQLRAHPDRLALRAVFRHWAGVYGVPAGLLEATAWMESGWQQSVVSSTGAIGIGQIEPYTATFISRDVIGLSTTLDIHSPSANIRMSAAYLGWLLRAANGSVANALGGYYQGLPSVLSSGPLTSTRQYVATIGQLWRAFRSG